MPENELSKNIRRLRKKRQLTQEQLAAMVGVSAQAVSKWESGGYPDPSLLPAIADSLDAGIDELYGRDVHKHHSREELGRLKKYSELAELIADPECMRVLCRLEGIGEAVFISREELSSASGASPEKVDKVVDMLKATPHDPRLTPLRIICLPAFRHITQILLDLRQQACVEFRQSDENLDGASDAQGSCGVALAHSALCSKPS